MNHQSQTVRHEPANIVSVGPTSGFFKLNELDFQKERAKDVHNG